MGVNEHIQRSLKEEAKRKRKGEGLPESKEELRSAINEYLEQSLKKEKKREKKDRAAFSAESKARRRRAAHEHAERSRKGDGPSPHSFSPEDTEKELQRTVDEYVARALKKQEKQRKKAPPTPASSESQEKLPSADGKPDPEGAATDESSGEGDASSTKSFGLTSSKTSTDIAVVFTPKTKV